MYRDLRPFGHLVTFANKTAAAWRLGGQEPDEARGPAYRAYCSDARTRTGYEDGFVQEAGGVEEGHSTDERAESIISKYARRQPGQGLIAESSVTMIQSHDDHREVDGEGDVQVRRWSRLLSWLESHGMDLSPSAFHVERRPRAGIFLPFVSSTPIIDLEIPWYNTGAGYGLFLTGPCPVGRIVFYDPATLTDQRKTATGLPLLRPAISIGEREDTWAPVPR